MNRFFHFQFLWIHKKTTKLTTSSCSGTIDVVIIKFTTYKQKPCEPERLVRSRGKLEFVLSEHSAEIPWIITKGTEKEIWINAKNATATATPNRFVPIEKREKLLMAFVLSKKFWDGKLLYIKGEYKECDVGRSCGQAIKSGTILFNADFI